MRRSALGRILWWAAPILLVAGIVLKAADLRKIADALVGARPGWLAGALVLAVLFTLNQGALYRAIFRLFDVKISLRASVRLALVMAFGSLAPAGTVAGIAYFVAAAREHGIDLEKSWMIGDSDIDIEAGKQAGCRTIKILNADVVPNLGLPDNN